MTINRIVAAAACFALLVQASLVVAAQKEPASQRWAIVSTKQLRTSGLPDLLTARLSQAKGMELVERDQLNLIEQELKFSTLTSAQTGDRVKQDESFECH